MKKLVLTVIAGAVCGVFGSAYADTAQRDRIHIAQASPTGTPPSSEKGMKTPSQIEDSRMDPAKGGAKGMAKGGAAAGSSTTGTGAASTSAGGASSSATTGADTGAKEMKKSRRAARREKG